VESKLEREWWSLDCHLLGDAQMILTRRIALALIGPIIVSNSFIVFSKENSQLPINAAAAVALSISIITVITAYKHRVDRFYVQMYFVFAVGLALWFIAEVTWTYYQFFSGIRTPFPSSADAFWLSGYGFFAFFLFKIYNFLSRASERYIVILVSFATAIVLSYALNLTFGIADLLSAQQGSLKWLISITYPVLDGVLLVPAMLIIWSLRDEKLASVWILLSLSIVLTTVADIGFGYSSVIDIEGKEEWIWDLLYNSSYLIMATALFLQHRIFAKKDHEKIILQK
jgi:hypothetical protein